MRSLLKIMSAVLVAATLSACSWFSEDEMPIETLAPQEIFERATQSLESGAPRSAAEDFEEIERLYPYSQWAKRAMIMAAYAWYEGQNYEETRAAASRFLDFYPTDEDAPYAQYLLALSYYDQITDVGRDQQNTVEAMQALREVIRRYPDSPYARDAELKFDLALDHLAGKEMEIGRYYLRRGHYTAAINRFQAVVSEYQTTTHTAEALHRMVECYLALGLDEEAVRAAAVLGYNFPGADWYEDSYALIQSNGLENASDEGSWLAQVYRQVIRGDWL